MDMRTEKWHAKLTLSGVQSDVQLSGSMTQILGQLIKTLQEAKVKRVGSLASINLMIQDAPIATNQQANNKLLSELNDLVDDSAMTRGPNQDETYDQYLSWLIEFESLTIEAAEYIAKSWFNQEQDFGLIHWMNDPKAIRFRQLNYSLLEFDKALPNEYRELKQYVLSHHERFASRLTFRVA